MQVLGFGAAKEPHEIINWKGFPLTVVCARGVSVFGFAICRSRLGSKKTGVLFSLQPQQIRTQKVLPHIRFKVLLKIRIRVQKTLQREGKKTLQKMTRGLAS